MDNGVNGVDSPTALRAVELEPKKKNVHVTIQHHQKEEKNALVRRRNQEIVTQIHVQVWTFM